MINVNDEIKQAYNDSTTQLDKIILNNNEYRITNVEYYDDTYEDGNIFGTAIARCLDFEIENNIDLEKQEVEYQTGIKINGKTQWISLGNFIIQDVEPNDTTNIVKVSAMDYMLKTNTPYQSNLKYENGTVRILDVLLEVCNNTGLELATTDFANKDFIVDSDQFSEGTLNRQVIQAVAQISGTFAKIKNDNKLYLITPIRKALYVKEVHKMLISELNSLPIEKLSECNNKYSLDSYKELILKRNTHPINLVCLGMNDIEGENTVLRDENSIKKDGENSLIINNNPFAYNQKKREQLITALFETVKGFSYTSFEIKGQAKPYLETGDEVAVIDKKGNVSSSFLLRFNYKSPNGLESEMSAPSIIKATVEYQNVPDALEIAKRTEYMVDKQNQRITQIIEKQEDYENKLTQSIKDIDGIVDTVKQTLDFTEEIEGTNELLLKDSVDYDILKFVAKAEEVEGSIMFKESLKFSNTLYPKFAGQTITLVVDTQSRANPSNDKKEFYFEIEPLHKFNDVSDEFVIECVTEKNCTVKILRYISKNGDTYTVKTNPTEEILATNLDIQMFKGTTYLYLKEYTNWNMYAKFMNNPNLNEYYASKVELESKIKQTADEINLSVSKKIDYVDVEENYSTKEYTKNVEKKADNAQSTANTAVTNASKAQSTADTATTKANNAQTSANNAQSTANTANTNAQNAQKTADTATTKAETAQSTADTAKSTADDINTNLSTNYYTKTETNSQIQQKADSITTSVTQQISTAKTEAIESANTSTDNKLKNYSTTSQMNSKITQTAEQINSEVSKKVGNDEIISTINQSAEEVKINADKIDIDGKAARFKTEINETFGPFVSSDKERVKKIILKEVTPTSDDYEKYDIDKDGTISVMDWSYINTAILQGEGYLRQNGTFSIDPYSSTNALSIYDTRYDRYSAILGIIKSYFHQLQVGNVLKVGETDSTSIYSNSMSFHDDDNNLSAHFGGTTYNGEKTFELSISKLGDSNSIIGKIAMIIYNGQANIELYGSNGNQTNIKNTGIETPTLIQTSKADQKKNFEKMKDNALDILKQIDIYKYNLKTEKDTDKKHIGFVIGDNYNYSKEVTSIDNEGVDIYSFVSLCAKSIQEQQEQIEELKEKDKQKDEIIADLIKRIEKLEKEEK